ncbi:MAG: TerC family protein [Planctomycetes bacterium]|nr:TerC family protein [Planctomycetota bacterium]
MEQQILFPFAEYWWFYGGFTALVLAVLALDLGVLHREPRVQTLRESATWSAAWVVFALLVGLGLWQYAHWRLPQVPALAGADHAALADTVGMEYLAGYVVEKALAVDNIFVIAMVFAYFRIPAHLQHRVLFYGIIGALLFRALFIALGAVLLQYQWIVLAAGAFLILTGVKMAIVGDGNADPGRNPLLRLLRRLMPITPELHGQSFAVRVDGRWMATPLLLCLALVEFSDIIFAIDSVPAIFALTDEPLIVFTSNICAILGLRAMYFLLAGVMDRFHLLKYGLALILVFVGLKMVWLNDAFGGKFPIVWSLGIIGGILAAAILASLWIRPRQSAATAPAITDSAK